MPVASMAVRVKSRLDMVVRRRIRQVHPLDMNNPAVRLKFQKFACDVETTAFAVCPFVTEFAAWFRLIDANGHSPAFRTEQPFLDDCRIGVGAVHGLGRRGEAPRHYYVRIAFSSQRQPAHRDSPFLGCFLVCFVGCWVAARTLSSRS